MLFKLCLFSQKQSAVKQKQILLKNKFSRSFFGSSRIFNRRFYINEFYFYFFSKNSLNFCFVFSENMRNESKTNPIKKTKGTERRRGSKFRSIPNSKNRSLLIFLSLKLGIFCHFVHFSEPSTSFFPSSHSPTHKHRDIFIQKNNT